MKKTEDNMINPQALKAERKRRNMTQEKLAEAVKCTKDTVSRWERGASVRVRSSLRDALCSVLRVDWEALSGTMDGKSPDPEPYKTKVTIDTNLRNQLQLVAERYGISLQEVINLAPLFTVILAEQSLVWRRNRLQEIESTLTEMQESLTQFDERLDEILSTGGDNLSMESLLEESFPESLLQEQESLENRDVFGRSIPIRSNALWAGGNPDDPHGPFIDFIHALKKDLPNPKEAVEFMESFNGNMIHGYYIATDTVKSLTGLSLCEEDDKNILWHIFVEGSIDLRQCIRVRQARSESGYREWLVEQARKWEAGGERFPRITR